MIFRKHEAAALLFGLLYLVIQILVVVVIIVFALVTCCIGALLIAIPYIGTIILLLMAGAVCKLRSSKFTESG